MICHIIYMAWAGCLDVELAGVVQEPFGLGVDEAEGEEDEMVHACYVGEKATEAEEDDHLPECQTLEAIEPGSREAHEEAYDD